jgi:tape measure domain-containing protein
VAQSTVRLIVDAQNAINPLKRVNDQTKLLSQNTDKLKGRLDKSNKSIRDTGTSAKTAQSGVKGLVSALKPLLAALAVVGTAKFVFVKTAELESQRKSLEVLTGSVEKTNDIIKEMQDFGAVTPFTSSQLIEITKRMKAFGVETEKVTDMTRRIADIAGTAGADIDSVSLAIGKVVAKNKFQQEENIMLLEKGINVTEELQRMTGMSAEALADAMSDGAISADQFRQAIVNLTSEGGEFFGGASAQADTLNGRLSTLQDTVETLARSIGEELEDEIKTVLNLAIDAVGQITKLIERVGTANKVGRLNMANIAMESRKEAREQLKQETGDRFAGFSPFNRERKKREKELFEEIKAAKIKEALDIREAKILEDKQQKTEKITENINNSANKADKLGKNLKKAEEPTKKIEEKTKATTTAIESTVTTSDFLNEKLGQTSFLVTDLALGSQKFAEELLNVKSEADILNEKFMEIGQSVEQGIVSNLTDAVMGTQSLADAAINVLNDLKRKLVEVAMQRAVSGIGSKIGGFFGNLFGGGKKSSGGGFLGGANAFTGGGGGISPLLGFANGGRPPVGKASIVGERGPEIFVPTSSGTIIPNNMIGGGGGVTNMVTVNVDASGAPQVQGSTAEANQLGQLIGQAIQEQLVKEKRPGGLLT